MFEITNEFLKKVRDTPLTQKRLAMDHGILPSYFSLILNKRRKLVERDSSGYGAIVRIGSFLGLGECEIFYEA